MNKELFVSSTPHETKVAVSYTHLDVYKRQAPVAAQPATGEVLKQVVQKAAAAGSMATGSSGKPAGLNPASSPAVSYTHLDVYKRQGTQRSEDGSARDPDKEGGRRDYAKGRNGAVGQLGKSKLPGGTAAHGQGERDRAADADFSLEHGADLHFRGDHQGCVVFLDADGKCSGLPAADLKEPLLFLHSG